MNDSEQEMLIEMRWLVTRAGPSRQFLISAPSWIESAILEHRSMFSTPSHAHSQSLLFAKITSSGVGELHLWGKD